MNTNNNYIIEQRTLDWYRARLGKITGSRVGDIFCKGRSKQDIFGKTAMAYLISVAAEKMLPEFIINDDENLSIYLDEISVTSKAMRIGTERETEARELYAEITGYNIDECSCIPHPEIQGFASSPDGLIKTDASVEGTLEIKCPKPATYLEYSLGVHTPEDLFAFNPQYFWQCMSHIAVTGAKWCDFVVYCPYISNPLHKVRIPRCEETLQHLYDRLTLALTQIDSIVDEIANLKS